MEDTLIFVMIDWLRYGEDETVTQMTVREYADMLQQRKTKQIPPCVIRRVSRAYFGRWKNGRHQEAYSKQIQEKYNVGPSWKQNRWFVEQVRPRL